MSYFLYIFFSLLPSVIWLCFYLKKDSHPEPKMMIIKIFVYGMLIAPIVALSQLTISWLLHPVASWREILSNFDYGNIIGFVNLILIAPLTEEYFKYFIVKKKALSSQNFDEPTDIMVYFIVAALGFAAIENLLVFSSLINDSTSAILNSVVLRFIGATFIHALASATFGYFVALSFSNTQKRKQYFYTGFSLAILSHASYNYLIYLIWNLITNETLIFVAEIILILFLTLLATFVGWQFQTLRKKISICKLQDDVK